MHSHNGNIAGNSMFLKLFVLCCCTVDILAPKVISMDGTPCNSLLGN